MRKFFSLIAAVLFAGSMMAIDFTLSSANEVTLEGVTVSFAKGSGANAPAWYENGLRLYANNEVTISCATPITGITFNWQKQGTKAFNTASASTGNYTHPTEPGNGVWTGSATSVTFTLGASGQLLLNTFSVTLNGQGGGDQPGGDTTIVPVDTTKVEPITCLDVYQMAKNDTVKLLNDVTVTYSNGANVWVKDGSASMLIYLPSGFTNTFKAGDVLSGVAGIVDIYQNIVYEIKPSADQAAAIVATAGEAPAPIQAAVIEAGDVNKYVVMPGASIEGAFTDASKTSLKAVIGTDTATIYNQFKLAYTFEAGKTYNIYGVVSAYKGAPQVYFISAEEAGEPQPTINYYVVGVSGDWTVKADYKLVANPANAGEYMGEFELAAGDQFKVISSADGVTVVDWFPTGMENNYQITDSGTYTVYFRPEGGVEGWHYGYINAIKKEKPVIPQYEVAQAIAAGLTDDTEILVRGVITKMQIKGKNFAKYGSVNIYVADATGAEGEFEFFNCYSLDKDSFMTTTPAYDETSTAWLNLKKVEDAAGNVIRLGDTVIAFGKYKLYNTTHELNTGCYLTDIKPAPVLPGDTINLVANSTTEWVRYTDATASQGWWQIQAQDSTYYITLSNAVSLNAAPGTYTVEDLDAEYSFIEVLATEEDVTFVSGSFTLAVSAEGVVTVVGELVGDDDNTYRINLTYKDPVAEKTVTVNINNAVLYDEYASILDLYAVYGENEDSVYVQISLFAENGFQGNFTEDDFADEYISCLVMDAEGQYDIFTASINVLPGNLEGTYKVTADILCFNNTLYKVTMLVGDYTEGIENQELKANSQKLIENGQLIIKKAGKKYSVIGAEIR